ncbi:MAG: hypothetical protein PHC52_13195, partial [Syntrophales bacterium]|nr:hypothetical protein [Syntrophales bacterium]
MRELGKGSVASIGSKKSGKGAQGGNMHVLIMPSFDRLRMHEAKTPSLYSFSLRLTILSASQLLSLSRSFFQGAA